MARRTVSSSGHSPDSQRQEPQWPRGRSVRSAGSGNRPPETIPQPCGTMSSRPPNRSRSKSTRRRCEAGRHVPAVRQKPRDRCAPARKDVCVAASHEPLSPVQPRPEPTMPNGNLPAGNPRRCHLVRMIRPNAHGTASANSCANAGANRNARRAPHSPRSQRPSPRPVRSSMHGRWKARIWSRARSMSPPVRSASPPGQKSWISRSANENVKPRICACSPCV